VFCFEAGQKIATRTRKGPQPSRPAEHDGGGRSGQPAHGRAPRPALQALWWKRILSAFTDRDNHQAIPYVLELLRSLGDQRATETAHQAWLLTYRDRADAIAEIRVLLAHAEELAEL